MAGELKHKDVGPELTYAEYHATDSHTIDGVDAGTVIAGKATLAEVKADTDIATAITNSHASGSDNQVIPDELSDLSDDATHRLVTDTEKSTWNGKTDLTTVKADTDIASAISLKHTQGTDQGLDTGGANAVTAAQAKAGYTHSGTSHAPSDAVSLTTVKADADIADAISKKHSVGDSIASSISDGDTTHSPDGNSVFDALALKLAKASNLSDVANAATAFGNIKQSTTTSATGVIELATQAEVLAGTDTSRAVVPVDLHAKLALGTNCLAPAQGIVMTAGTSTTFMQIADNANLDVGTGDFSVICKLSKPDWTPSAAQPVVGKLYYSAPSYLGWFLYVNTDGKLWLRIFRTDAGTTYASTIATGLTDGTVHKIGVSVTREQLGVAGSIVFTVDDVQLGSAVAITAAEPVDISNSATFGISGFGVTRYAATFYDCILYKRALSVAEIAQETLPTDYVLALEPEGIQPAPGQWLDSSSNKLHAWQPAAGSSLTRYKNTFEIRGINTWAGTHEAQSIAWATDASKAILPAGCYIDSIIGVITGATIEDIIIGDGSDTDRWVEATTGLAAGTVAFTIANHISDGTHYEMVVDPDANFTGSTEWTIRGTILD